MKKCIVSPSQIQISAAGKLILLQSVQSFLLYYKIDQAFVRKWHIHVDESLKLYFVKDDRRLKCDLNYFYMISCNRKIVRIDHCYVRMYVCMPSARCAHQYLKMADFSPVHCLFLHLRFSNHISFRSAGHFALSNQTVGIQIL